MALHPLPRPQNRKRLHDNPPQEPSKKPRLTANEGLSTFPPQFWHNLSKTWLTSSALDELDRQNTSAPKSEPDKHNFYNSIPTRDLSRFARQGGPDLSGLRGYPAPDGAAETMSARRSSRGGWKQTRSASTRSRRSSAYDNNFEQHLHDYGVYANNRKSKPANLEEIRQRLTASRVSLSPDRFPESAFEDFQRKNDEVVSEGKVMSTLLPIIYGKSDIPHEENILFTGLDPLTDGTIAGAKPDFYDGALLVDIDKQIQQDLGRHIIPSTANLQIPALPNFFVEAKAPKGGSDVAKRQACYDAALGARAMHSLQTYGEDDPLYDNNAYTISATYHDGALKMYATHLTRPTGPGKSPEYHMTQLMAWMVTGDSHTFRQGATAFRNARDWAKEQRDRFIAAANARATEDTEQSNLESSGYNNVSDTEVQPEDSETSADELATDSQYYTSQRDMLPAPVKGPSVFEEAIPDTDRNPNSVDVNISSSSADELASVVITKSIGSNKRAKRRKSIDTVSKLPRRNNSQSRRGRQSKVS